MMQVITATSVAQAGPVSKLGNFPAVRGFRGIQMQLASGTVFYGGANGQPLAVPSAAPTDVLPIVHLNDLWLKGIGVVNIICFL